MKQFAGKVAVITGAASGIGRALAQSFGAEGMKLVLADVEREPLAATEKELRGQGFDVLAVQADVSDAASMDKLGAQTLERFGTAHVVCNNAGVAGGGATWELTTEDWQFVLGPNLWGVIHGIRVFGPHLVAQNEGHILNTASAAGLVAPPGLSAYAASKHAVVAISESMYAELKGAGSAVGVSVLCPGFVDTQIFDAERHRKRVGAAREAALAGGTRGSEVREQIRAAGVNFMDPSEVARQSLDAIRSGRLYVLTHDETRDHLRARTEAVLAGTPPSLPFGTG